MPKRGAASVRLLCDAGAAIGESPLWQHGRVLWTDPVRSRLLSYEHQSGLQRWDAARAIWSLARAPDDRIVGTLDDCFCSVSLSGTVEAGPAAPLDPGCRLNDMAVDPAGGLWAGAMHRGVLACRGAVFYAAALEERPVTVAAGLGVPNGMKFSADGTTLYLVDTLARTLLAFPAADGRLGEPLIVTDFMGIPGKPDGMAIAPDGSFWVAMWGGACVVQIAPDGATLRLIELPAAHVSSLCLAGPNRLLVSTSRMRLGPADLERQPGSGGLFAIGLEEEP